MHSNINTRKNGRALAAARDDLMGQRTVRSNLYVSSQRGVSGLSLVEFFIAPFDRPILLIMPASQHRQIYFQFFSGSKYKTILVVASYLSFFRLSTTKLDHVGQSMCFSLWKLRNLVSIVVCVYITVDLIYLSSAAAQVRPMICLPSSSFEASLSRSF